MKLLLAAAAIFAASTATVSTSDLDAQYGVGPGNLGEIEYTLSDKSRFSAADGSDNDSQYGVGPGNLGE